MAERVTLRGTVRRRAYAPGSKGEHLAVMLDADDGRSYLLRRPGANPYVDRELNDIVGATITATGAVHRDLLFLDSFEVVES